MARTPPGYYLHLIAWAQVGVLIRVYLAELFGSACPALGWAPCLTSNGARWGGAHFTDLPANLFGSFLMGLLVSSDVLSNSLRHTLTVEAPMAVLPTWSPLQQHVALQVGLRTGLCGSLTTFASWLTQMVIMLVGGLPGGTLQHSQWVEALGGLVVGTLAAVAALVTGQHVALLAYHRLNPGAFIPFGSPAPEQRKLEDDSRQAAAAAADEAEEQQRRLSSSSMSLGRLRTVSTTQEGRATIVVVQECLGEQQRAGVDLQSLSSLKQQQPRGSLELAELQQDGSSTGLYSSRAAAAVGAQQHSQPGSPSRPVTIVSEVDEVAEPSTSLSQLLADGFAGVAIVVLTGVSLWRIIHGAVGSLPDRDAPFAQQWFWWSMLLGPLGCYARYYLSRFNGALRGGWKWFPLGTFAANMAACVIDYVMKAMLVRHVMSDAVSPDVLAGVVGGVGGCLSTVSTWVVEIQRLLLSFPKTSHGYQYIAISLGSALALGLLIYGVPVWTL